MKTREEELEQRIAQLELIVLRAAAQSPQLPAAIIEMPPAAPAPPKKRKAKAAPAAKPDIAPVVQLQAVEGALSPLNAILRDLKATQKSIQGITPLCGLDDVLDRDSVKASTGVNAEHVRRAWATIFHFRLEDDGGPDLDQARADLVDFKQWARDPMFLRCLNTDPALAVCWFVDVMLAANGELGDEDR